MGDPPTTVTTILERAGARDRDVMDEPLPFPHQLRVLKCRLFGGLSVEETGRLRPIGPLSQVRRLPRTRLAILAHEEGEGEGWPARIRKPITVPLLVLMLLLAPLRAGAGPPPPIIDMHMHARDAPDPERELPSKLCLPVTVYGVVDPQCADPLVAPATDEAMVERTVEILERRNVIGVISDDSLATLRRFREAAPDRLIPAYELTLGDEGYLSPEELRGHLVTGDFAVLGEIAIQYEGIAPDDERMEPYWALAEELDIPVALHLGEGYPGAPYLGSPGYRVRLGSPLLLEEVLVRHPDLRIFVMHYGSPLIDEMIAVLSTYPQVYIDVGGNTWPYPREFFYSQLEKFVAAGFSKRILFGSDQMLWPELIEISIAIIEEAPFLTEEQKRDIFYNNAARFLRLSEEEIARHHAREQPAQRPADLVVTGATLIDGTGAPPRPGTSIRIRDGRIAAVTPDSDLGPVAGATVIDATGKYVIPGLADMHVHFSLGAGLPRQADETEKVLARELYYGVTTILQLGATDGSTQAIRALQERRAAGSLTAPSIYGTGGHLTLQGTHPVYTLFPSAVREAADTLAAATPMAEPVDLYPLGLGLSFVRTEEAARKAVRERAEGGMDAIKITVESGPTPFGDDHPQMPVEMIRTIVDEATRHGLRVFAHVSSRDELEAALEGGAAGVVHAARNDPLPDPALADQMAAAGFVVAPTLSLYSEPVDLDDPFLRAAVSDEEVTALSRPDFVEGVRQRWECCAPFPDLLASVRMLHERGVPIALGTDTGNAYVFPGYSVHRELELLVRAGLTPMEALEAATRGAAEMIGAENDFGTVQPGKRADLLILGGNPLDDIRNTRSLEVVINEGRVVDREKLLSSAQPRAAAPPEDRIDSIFARYDRPDSPGCAVGVYRAAEVVFANGYGLANLERCLPISPATVFDIASPPSRPCSPSGKGGSLWTTTSAGICPNSQISAHRSRSVT